MKACTCPRYQQQSLTPTGAFWACAGAGMPSHIWPFYSNSQREIATHHEPVLKRSLAECEDRRMRRQLPSWFCEEISILISPAVSIGTIVLTIAGWMLYRLL